AIKKSTEDRIENYGKTVGTYLYEHLLKDPNQKLNGELINIIDRKFYKNELKQILEKQKEFHPELLNEDLFQKSIIELYPKNSTRQKELKNKDLCYLLIDDVIYYQRDLKKKNSTINKCSFESREYYLNGEKQIQKINCIAKSKPLYQEFRTLQFIKNLKVYEIIDGLEKDITSKLLPDFETKEHFFEWLNDKEKIDQLQLLSYKCFDLHDNVKNDLIAKGIKRPTEKAIRTELLEKYRWNYSKDNDRNFLLNETRFKILKYLKKVDKKLTLTNEQIESLWLLLYSAKDERELKNGLQKFSEKNKLPKKFSDIFISFPPFKKEYGAYSEKALKKLLSLVRFGKYWSFNKIDNNIQNKIMNILNGEVDDSISDRVREKTILLQDKNDFQDLPLWLASYVAYNRFSEVSEIKYWDSPDKIEFLKQHSIGNPIVEKIINETLKLIKDIWVIHGKSCKNFFSEIHIELSREIKSSSKKRAQITNNNTKNQKLNNLIKSLLIEMASDTKYENVTPYSPSQQEILKIYDEGIYSKEENSEKIKEINKIRNNNKISKSDITKYKLWLEQGYISPYTGKIIPLTKLFTAKYQKEHIIPQTKFFDDSFNNKVICEAEVNKLKDNSLAMNFIKAKGGKAVKLSDGETVTILNQEEYKQLVRTSFKKNSIKLRNLLLEEIPDTFTKRQLNDTKYISKLVLSLLSNIVREKGELESTAKRIVSTNGQITSILRNDWGLNNIWNKLITPRFERLNNINKNKIYGNWENKKGKNVFQINYLNDNLSTLNTKRIDHRHHALDALIVACTTRNHINFLNNQYAKSRNQRHDLRAKLKRRETITTEGSKKQVFKDFIKPWESFTQDALKKLETTIVNFKVNKRIINKTINWYKKWEKQKDGTYKKIQKKQTKGDAWAIRKPLHIDTIYGIVCKKLPLKSALENYKNIIDENLKHKIKELKEVNKFDNNQIINFFKECNFIFEDNNIQKVEVYDFKDNRDKTILSSSRQLIDESFTPKKIGKVLDPTIRNILLKHLNSTKYNNKFDSDGNPIKPEKLAFSPEGLKDLNKNIKHLNNNKEHQPIKRVKLFETLGNKIKVGYTQQKNKKFAETATGTNLFLGIYSDNNKRDFKTIPLILAIQREKEGLNPCPDTDEKGNQLLFSLSPNELVFVPNNEERKNPNLVDFENLSKDQIDRIYKFVSCTGSEAYFVPSRTAKPIIENENGTNNKSQRIIEFNEKTSIKNEKNEPVLIKTICWKIEVNRLGKIIKVIK
ncbi:type II CRISPR RNA-guided endonuclease Cas9, partial [Ornithobacterium rhinotracheale]